MARNLRRAGDASLMGAPRLDEMRKRWEDALAPWTNAPDFVPSSYPDDLRYLLMIAERAEALLEALCDIPIELAEAAMSGTLPELNAWHNDDEPILVARDKLRAALGWSLPDA